MQTGQGVLENVKLTCSLSNMTQTGQFDVMSPSTSRQVTMTFVPPRVKSHSGEKSSSSRLALGAWLSDEVCVPAVPK